MARGRVVDVADSLVVVISSMNVNWHEVVPVPDHCVWLNQDRHLIPGFLLHEYTYPILNVYYGVFQEKLWKYAANVGEKARARCHLQNGREGRSILLMMM